MANIINFPVKGNDSYERAFERAYNKSGIDYMKLMFGTPQEKLVEKRKEFELNKKLSMQDMELKEN